MHRPAKSANSLDTVLFNTPVPIDTLGIVAIQARVTRISPCNRPQGGQLPCVQLSSMLVGAVAAVVAVAEQAVVVTLLERLDVVVV